MHAAHERAAGERQHLEEAALAERAQLHREREALEYRLLEEAEAKRHAIDEAERLRREPLLARLFNQAISKERSEAASPEHVTPLAVQVRTAPPGGQSRS